MVYFQICLFHPSWQFRMTVNSILTAYLIIAILKALFKKLRTSRLDLLWLGLNLYFPTLNLYLWGPLVEPVEREKSLFTLKGLVSCDANITSSTHLLVATEFTCPPTINKSFNPTGVTYPVHPWAASPPPSIFVISVYLLVLKSYSLTESIVSPLPTVYILGQ